MDNKIDVVITMGGLGSRFRKMGYAVPKYMIEVKGKSLFEWSMISLEGYKEDIGQYIFVAMKDNIYDVEGFIKLKCEKKIRVRKYSYNIIGLSYRWTSNNSYVCKKILEARTCVTYL